MHRFRNLAAIVTLVVLAALFGVSPRALAQTYPTNNPGYTPTPILAPVTCSAACDVNFVTNNIGTVVLRISGSGTGVAANVQGTETRSSQTWSNLFVSPVTSSATAPGQTTTITGIGLYRVPASGLAAVRFHLTAVTGSITVAMAGNQAPAIVQSIPLHRLTYSAAVTALAPAASATDFFTLTGSATATVRVTKAECSGISTAAATATVNALIRSTANTAGTSAAATAVPHDSNDPAATATALSYTANPTTGTLVGVVRSGKLTTGTAASSAVVAAPLAWNFDTWGPQQEFVLRGVTQVFALNGAGASFSAGAALNCSVTWTEEP